MVHLSDLSRAARYPCNLLTKIAIALDVENELEDLFNNVPFASIEEVINEQTK